MNGEAERSFVMEFLFKDTSFKFETLRAAGFAVDNGADISEVLLTAAAIPEGDEEAWMREWKATADRIHERAKYSQEHGDKVSAREAFLRASAYYRNAEFYRREDPVNDPDVANYLVCPATRSSKPANCWTAPLRKFPSPTVRTHCQAICFWWTIVASHGQPSFTPTDLIQQLRKAIS